MITSIGNHSKYIERDKTDFIVLHHSATKKRQNYDVFNAHMDHIARGFSGIGYHIVIEKTGVVRTGRPLNVIGAHCNTKIDGESVNTKSIGICVIGGLDSDGESAVDNFNDNQYKSLQAVLSLLTNVYPEARIVRHKDLANTLCNELNLDKLNEIIR